MALAMTLLMDPLGMMLSALLRRIYTKLDLRSSFSLRTVLGISFFSLLASAVLIMTAVLAGPVIASFLGLAGKVKVGNPYDPYAILPRITFYGLVFFAWSVAYVWLKAEFYKNLQHELIRESTAAAQRAELQMLRLQLNPHFMFNALNNIASQIPEQPETALEMTHDLAEFLRYSLDHRVGLIVPLAHEVEAVTAYLGIEHRRFGDRLKFTVDTEPEALRAKVPCFLLQPLVENAVKHGLNTSSPPWELVLKITQENDSQRVLVRNTGQLAPDWSKRVETGTGLANLRRRLELHFPGRHVFSLRQEGDQVSSEIVLHGEPCLV